MCISTKSSPMSTTSRLPLDLQALIILDHKQLLSQMLMCVQTSRPKPPSTTLTLHMSTKTTQVHVSTEATTMHLSTQTTTTTQSMLVFTKTLHAMCASSLLSILVLAIAFVELKVVHESHKHRHHNQQQQ